MPLTSTSRPLNPPRPPQPTDWSNADPVPGLWRHTISGAIILFRCIRSWSGERARPIALGVVVDCGGCKTTHVGATWKGNMRANYEPFYGEVTMRQEPPGYWTTAGAIRRGEANFASGGLVPDEPGAVVEVETGRMHDVFRPRPRRHWPFWS